MPEIDEIKKDLVDVGEEEGAEINLDEKGNPEKPEIIKEEEIEVEQVKEEPVEAKKENDVEEKKPDELKEYSDGVQKRIAKLTRKMREAERQKEEALTYAHSVKSQKEHVEKSNGMFEIADPKKMPEETLNVVGMGFRKTDTEFRDNFNKALAKVMANPAKMMKRAGKYGYGEAQIQPAHMTTAWACNR